MSVEYKVTKGIYMRKYRAKNIWEVGGACVEKQRTTIAQWFQDRSLGRVFANTSDIQIRKISDFLWMLALKEDANVLERFKLI